MVLTKTDVTFTWLVTGDDNFSTVTGYRVKFLNKLSSSYEENDTCNSNLAGLTCSVPMSFFLTIGYSAGENIQSQVEAINGEGYSLASSDSTTAEVV